MYVTAPPSDIKSRLLYCMTFHWNSDDSAALGMSHTSTASQAEQKAACAALQTLLSWLQKSKCLSSSVRIFCCITVQSLALQDPG